MVHGAGLCMSQNLWVRVIPSSVCLLLKTDSKAWETQIFKFESSIISATMSCGRRRHVTMKKLETSERLKRNRRCKRRRFRLFFCLFIWYSKYFLMQDVPFMWKDMKYTTTGLVHVLIVVVIWRKYRVFNVHLPSVCLVLFRLLFFDSFEIQSNMLVLT